MKVVDLHCDTMAELWYSQWDNKKPMELEKNSLHVDLEKLRKGDYLLQNFAIFVNLGRNLDPFESALSQIDIFYREMEKNKEKIRAVKTYEDIETNIQEGKICAMLTVEEGAVCKGKLSFLRILYQLGVRMMTLTWNFENELGFPNLRSKSSQSKYEYEFEKGLGLKKKGIEFLIEMERLGIIVDVSHLSDEGFYDVLQYTKKPFVASHSNARALCRHPRNLTDDMIRKLAQRGGVIGLNYSPNFLEEGETEEDCHSSVALMASHARHITNIGGIECLALGSDFDGIEGKLEMKNCSMLPLLLEALEKEGFKHSQIEAIFYKNVLHLYKELLI
ncbi:dipeptidase [Candidatus Galacturonibacter soehngenii]|uniref:Membrane dipeptidase n=1 Tax=Candidatus Galacturonatibacter soehngenii TaxID=2307010 RepID=A0A7V7UC11_9FIRM|nr:dipeptidase [Candidatus Galacturonibacter soehngenii]KAB1438470.1 membrane dipeptidase [Candidatus Galacturonibacter soehngenii]